MNAKERTWLCVCAGLLLAGHHAWGEGYAVLAGVSHYAIGNEMPQVNLEGPANDLPALRQALVRSGFAPSHVTVLLDREASRKGVLDALGDTVARARAGDFVIFYFSGHGTSSSDKEFHSVSPEIGPDTGALIAYDVDPSSRERLVQSMIIGRRDLRPILSRLDPGARALVILDACYSQDSAKGIELRGEPRFLNMSDYLLRRGLAGEDPAPGGAEESLGPGDGGTGTYPYLNVVSLAAAARSETAADMGSRLLASGKVRTIDGKPHGAFTNSLLKGLAGAADTDHNGAITVDELYRFAREDVRATFKHTPQMLQPEGDDMARAMVLRDAIGPALGGSPALTAAPDRVVLLRLETVTAAFRLRLARLPEVRVTAGDYDLLLRASATGYDLYNGTRTLLAHFPAGAEDAVSRRIASEPALATLIDWSFAHQDFNLALEVTDPAHQGSYRDAQHLQVEATATAPCHLLLLDIDAQGTITVLYPATAEETQKVAAGAAVRLMEGTVRPPFGTEHLKLFAFRERPAHFDRWLCRQGGDGKLHCPQFTVGSAEFKGLMELLRESDYGRAQAILRLVTTEGDTVSPAAPATGEAPVSSEAIARALHDGAMPRTMTLTEESGGSGRARERAIDLPIEFEFDRFDMTESGRRQAVELGRALAQPSLAGARFLVVGHTDSRGSAVHNQLLSERRAQALVRYLTLEFGIDAARLRAEGRGSREPRVPGDTEQSRRLNRRVEVRVVAP